MSGTFQSIPGRRWRPTTPCRTRPSCLLGRSLSGNLTNATVNIVAPATEYGDRINQLDFRAGKLLRFGRTRTQVSLDLYNVLNVDAVQTYNQTFVPGGAWLLPTGILAARFAKVTVQVDF